MYTREYLLNKSKKAGIRRVAIALPCIAIGYSSFVGLVFPELFWKILGLAVLFMAIITPVSLVISNKLTKNEATQDMMIENQLKLLLRKKKIDASTYNDLLSKLYNNTL